MWLAAIYGMAIGAVLGLSGAGDGILAVPALVLGLHWTLPQATPVALLAVGLAAAIGAADGWLRRLVRWRAALLMAVLGVAISPIGVRAAHALPATVLTAFFAGSHVGFVGSAHLSVRDGWASWPLPCWSWHSSLSVQLLGLWLLEPW